MNDETTTIIQERIAQLPDELQQAISQTDIKGILQRISSKYNLRADQAMALEQETLFVLLGLESRMDFTANIKREMIISEAAATAITSDLDTDLFLAVRHLLMQLHAEDAVREENTHRDMPVAERESAKEIPMAKTETAPSPVSTPGTRTVPGDIARIKLEQMVQKTTTPSGSPGYPAHDPYREPIE